VQRAAIECRAKVYLMAVEDEYDMWPEMGTRKRHWVPLEEAFVLSKHAWMHDALAEVHALAPQLLAPYQPLSPLVERVPVKVKVEKTLVAAVAAAPAELSVAAATLPTAAPTPRAAVTLPPPPPPPAPLPAVVERTLETVDFRRKDAPRPAPFSAVFRSATRVLGTLLGLSH
jgi:hypothetical protein